MKPVKGKGEDYVKKQEGIENYFCVTGRNACGIVGNNHCQCKNNDDEAFTFTFNATTPMSWTKSRAKEDTSSLYAKMTDMGGAYYVTCYGAGAKAKNIPGGCGTSLPSSYHKAARYDSDYVRFTSAGEWHYISSWVKEDGYDYAVLVGVSGKSYHNVHGVWSPDSI